MKRSPKKRSSRQSGLLITVFGLFPINLMPYYPANNVYGQNPEWTKSRIEQNPEVQNPELDKIPNWTKTRTRQNPELDKIPNGQNPE